MATHGMASFLFLVLFSFCLLQASRCQFVFDAWLDAIVNINDCYDSLEVIHPPCETYLPKFCLREGRTVSNARSRDLDDCPLGRVGRFGPEGALPIVKPINSTLPWTVSMRSSYIAIAVEIAQLLHNNCRDKNSNNYLPFIYTI